MIVPPPESDSPLRHCILIAEDDDISRELVRTRLVTWGYDVLSTRDGHEALAALSADDAPPLAILDWMMPGVDGPEICRRMRAENRAVYIILLTARGRKDHVVEGLAAGADDYLTKPFDKEELHARIAVGLRLMALQARLAARVAELSAGAVAMKKTLSERDRLLSALHASNQEIDKLREGLVTVCAWTKRVKHEGKWIAMDEFLSKHLHLKLTHGISEEAAEEFMAKMDTEDQVDPTLGALFQPPKKQPPGAEMTGDRFGIW